MPAENNPLTEQESLRLITDMIRKTQSSYHERGTSALLWGTVVTIASLVSFASLQFQFKLPFDIWLIVLFAIIPQIFISTRERKEKKVRRFEDDAIETAWMVYGFTIFGLVFYMNIAPAMGDKFMREAGYHLVKQFNDPKRTAEAAIWGPPSGYSLFILIYAFPTMITGVVKKYWIMVIGAIISYALFLVSLFVPNQYDMLCGALAAIACWLIPGIYLRSRYQKMKAHVPGA